MSILAAYTAAFVLRFRYGFVGEPEALPTFTLYVYAAAPVWIVILALFGLYELRPLTPASEIVRRIFHSVSTGILFLILFSFVLKEDLSRGWVIAVWGCCLTALVTARLITRKVLHLVRAGGRMRIPALVVGSNHEGRAIARSLLRQSWVGIDPIGFLLGGAEGADEADSAEGLPVHGMVSEASEVVARTGVRMIVVAISALSPEGITRLYRELQDSPVEIAVSAGTLNIAASRVEVEPLDGMALFSLRKGQLSRPKAAAKRTFDVIGALLALLVGLPIVAAASLAIQLTESGPVFFRQTRVGKGGRHFLMYKFRTMLADAEGHASAMQALNEADGHLFKIRDDPRVTKVGGVLRRWAIDEIPQLLNVIRGEMSLVGPRPPLPEEVARYDGALLGRLKVKPGMTGLWQANGRHSLKWEDYVRYDLFYVENWSLSMDLYVLWKTIPAVLSRKGAH